MPTFFDQPQDTSCFVIAVANACVYKGLPVCHSAHPNIQKAKEIAGCLNGNTIHHLAVIDYFQAPLQPATPQEVLNKGGILTILHPIFNGHALFLYPEKGSLTLVNSWLGPNVLQGIGKEEIEPFITDNFSHFSLREC